MMGRRALAAALAALFAHAPVGAHDGPPFPIVSDAEAGPYIVSVWTDPDTTDDGSPGGQFWVMIAPRGEGRDTPSGTTALVTASPLDRPGAPETARAEPVRGEPSTQFAGLVLDHEGRFAVRVAIDGPLGPAVVESEVMATYDLRPAPILLLLYLLPFLLVGLLWVRRLAQRRRAGGPERGRTEARA